MAMKTVIPFPIFAPTPTTTAPSSTELRFSRWNNANADKFNHRPQQIIEDDLRRFRRFQSALNITSSPSSPAPPSSNPTFKSTGTPSSPSRPSIPAKKSKYSKQPHPNTNNHHPAFRRHKNTRLPPPDETEVKVADGGGLSYVVPGAPFEFMYSYTETPRARPVGLREPAVAPFGPGTMPRPWTGRKPLPGSKKELPQFDSFTPPPAGKKGVRPVQQPGPYLPGSGPRYTVVREEVLGEPLTEEEVRGLVEGCKKTKRQLNMGRDGLTHNMLDNIHAHWKRRRVCKIKCKGVCTVDMDNVCQQLEERTGGKIIHRKGGVLYLFRGRNYNYKTRPRFPLMLWKPVSPVYPRLVKRIPEGLTLQEATDMRRRGRELPPICKLGKNGVYINLVKTVREAFEVCDLVRINCQGLNPSDYRKIGAKLKDLVPCVLISFEHEHVLMWRGKDWKSTFILSGDGSTDYKISESDSAAFLGSDTVDSFSSDDELESSFSEDEQESACSEDKQGSAFSEDKQESVSLGDQQESKSITSNISSPGSSRTPNLNEVLTNDSDVSATGFERTSFGKVDVTFESYGMIQSQTNALERETPSVSDTRESETRTVVNFINEEAALALVRPDFKVDADGLDYMKDTPTNSSGDSAAQGELLARTETAASSSASSCTEGVLDLLRQAVESGSAVVLDDSSVDADMVYERSVAFAQIAPPGPVFIHHPRKVVFQRCKDQESMVAELDETVSNKNELQEAKTGPLLGKKTNGKTSKGRKSPRTQKPIDFKENFLSLVPQGSLKVDELAKLLA